jgi:hypothetical protein
MRRTRLRGADNTIQATMDMPVTAAKATRGAAAAVTRAVTFKKRELIAVNDPESP